MEIKIISNAKVSSVDPLGEYKIFKMAKQNKAIIENSLKVTILLK